MRLFTVITLLFTTTLLLAQSDQQKIEAAVERLRKAMIDGDKKTLLDITYPSLNYGHSSGVVEDQATFAESIVSGKNDFISLDQTNQTIKIENDIAYVRHNFKAEIKLLDGSVINPDIGVFQVWRKQKGVWKLLARQAYKH